MSIILFVGWISGKRQIQNPGGEKVVDKVGKSYESFYYINLQYWNQIWLFFKLILFRNKLNWIQTINYLKDHLIRITINFKEQTNLQHHVLVFRIWYCYFVFCYLQKSISCFYVSLILSFIWFSFFSPSDCQTEAAAPAQ